MIIILLPRSTHPTLEGKFEKIEELLRCIDERLSKLEGEKEELKAYQTLDKQRR